MVGWSLLALSALVASALAQSASWTDPDTGITYQSYVDPAHQARYGFVFPPLSSTGATAKEFIGIMEQPIANKWAGLALGGGMNGNLLVVAWPNSGSFVFSPRMASNYEQPTVYKGPTISTIAPASYINSTHWKWTFRCQNCTTWSSGASNGGMTLDGTNVMGWAISTVAVDNPSNSASNFQEHTDFSLWGQDTADAHVDSTTYAEYLTGSGKPPTSTTSRPTSTTSTGPTISATPYDYIVVGAGPGGIVTADRLSEAGKKVLLIERGGPSVQITGGKEVPPWPVKTTLTRFDIPGLFESMFSSNNPWWWCNDIVPFAGCLIGGGTAINGILYWYPTDTEFATTNGWPAGWQDISAARNKLKARIPATDSPSTDGKRYLDQAYDAVSKILIPQGYVSTALNANTNSRDHVYGHSEYFIAKGKRNGPASTYLQTALARSNFKLMQYTNVLNVVRNGGTITGVRTNNTQIGGNGIIPLNPNGRVILSAGTFGTARVLFRSGIGPSDMINIVKGNADAAPYLPPSSSWINLPVGYNVADNPSINCVFIQPPIIDDYEDWANIWDNPRVADAKQYVKDQSGVFAFSSPRINFWRTYGGSDQKTRWVQGTSRPGACCFTPSAPYNETAQFTITTYLSVGVTSRGRIGIDAAMRMNTITNPWFTDPVDKDVMIQAITDLLSTYKQVPNVTLIDPPPGKSVADHVNGYPVGNLNSNHWVGSAKIGTSSSNSVVDVNTKVFNTNNLFVIDASIIPGMPMGNPTGAILTVAEAAVARVLALSGGP